MDEKKGEAKRQFNLQQKEKERVELTEMVKQDQPAPRPKPPTFGQDVDRQYFNQRWQKQVDEHRQKLNPFEEIDQQAQPNDKEKGNELE